MLPTTYNCNLHLIFDEKQFFLDFRILFILSRSINKKAMGSMMRQQLLI